MPWCAQKNTASYLVIPPLTEVSKMSNNNVKKHQLEDLTRMNDGDSGET